MRLVLALLLCTSTLLPADIYYLLWFDTEDFMTPESDDATLRLAKELEARGIPATFKIVGEKARVWERNKRQDVIRAVARHDIGYHTENHSIPPSPAAYMKELGLVEGAEEFVRRQEPGVRDLERLFGVTPSCYGQPGSSWGAQSMIGLRKLGIPVYMDEGRQVNLNMQPFWYGGILYVFGLQQFTVRANLDDETRLPETLKKFDDAVAELQKRGGGVIHTYYHPTEFVTTKFWDEVNFNAGSYRPPSEYQPAPLRTKESAERAYRLALRFAEHVKKDSRVRIITARQLPQIFQTEPTAPNPAEAKRALQERIDMKGEHSAADLLLAVLGLKPRHVDGPSIRKKSTYRATTIPRPMFEYGKRDAIGFIERFQRLPSHVWFGSEYLALPDFVATLARDNGSGPVTVHRGGTPAFEAHIATDPQRSFNWAIHPVGFSAPEALEMGRLQAWTLKPAKLR